MRPFQFRRTRASRGPWLCTRRDLPIANCRLAVLNSDLRRPVSSLGSPEQVCETQGGDKHERDDAVAGNVVPATDLGQIFYRGNPDQKNRAKEIPKKRD